MNCDGKYSSRGSDSNFILESVPLAILLLRIPGWIKIIFGAYFSSRLKEGLDDCRQIDLIICMGVSHYNVFICLKFHCRHQTLQLPNFQARMNLRTFNIYYALKKNYKKPFFHCREPNTNSFHGRQVLSPRCQPDIVAMLWFI